MINIEEEITSYIAAEIDVLKNLNQEQIEKAFAVLYTAIRAGKTIYCFGNGGSASTASHFKNDFDKIIGSKLDKKFQFICLNDNIATVMAIANDISYGDIFSFQLEGRLKPGDIIMAISGSGNSANIINAVEYAKKCGNTVIGLTGFDGGKLRLLADVNLHAPIHNMQITEDIHLMFNHLLVSTLLKFVS